MRYTALEREVEIRKVAEGDSREEINRLFHTHHAVMADASLRRFYLDELLGQGSTENPKGELYLAIAEDDKVLGGLVFFDPENTRGCPYYDKPGVASIGPFAVVPQFQGHGLGGAMLQLVENRAKEAGAKELALDISPEDTHSLHTFLRQGFRFAENARWPDSNSRCLVLTKQLD